MPIRAHHPSNIRLLCSGLMAGVSDPEGAGWSVTPLGYARRSMPNDQIVIRGAREHNLKNIDLTLPRDKLIVITGLSGSGKSSLAFDTIYAEGQRRYVESLSAYARQFLGQMEKPDVDHIEGLSPAISIDQKGTSKNPRSTVGTVTEIYDYLRLMYARIGHPHCPNCGREISKQSIEQIADQVLLLPEGTRLLITAPMVQGRKGEHRDVLDEAKRTRLRPRAHRRRAARPLRSGGSDRARQEVPARHRGGGGPRHHRAGAALTTARVTRAGVEAERRAHPAHPRRSRQRHAGVALLRGVRVRVLRHLDGGARPAQLLLQQSARRVSRVHRSRCAARGGSRCGGPRPVTEHRRGRTVRMDARTVAALDDGSARDRLQALQDPAQRRVERARGKGAQRHPLRAAQGRDGAHALHLAQRTFTQLRGRLRGRDQQPAAALPGDRVRVGQAGDRAADDAEAVPCVQGRAAQAGVSRGDHRRDEHRRVLQAQHQFGVAAPRTLCASASASRRSRGR